MILHITLTVFISLIALTTFIIMDKLIMLNVLNMILIPLWCRPMQQYKYDLTLADHPLLSIPEDLFQETSTLRLVPARPRQAKCSE